MRFPVAGMSARHFLRSSRSSTPALGLSSDAFFLRRFFSATLEPASSPSKVLFLRTQADDITQEDVNDLIKPFGSINKFVVMRSGKDALLEMGDVEEAKSVIQHFSEDQALLRGKEVQVEYSTRQELRAEEAPKVEQPKRVLLATIHNSLYQMNVDILHKVFSPHGTVEKIVIFQKSAVQAFIAFESHEAATAAKTALNGRQIFDGCCRLDIKFAINQDITVSANTEFARDYTNDSLPTEANGAKGSILGSAPTGLAPGLTTGLSSASLSASPLSAVLPFGVTGNNGKCSLLVSNIHELVDEEKLYNLFSAYGRVLRIKRFDNANQALIQMADAIQAELALTYLKGTPLLGTTVDVSLSKHNTIRHPRTRDYSADPYNRFNNEYIKNCCPPSKILHISNLSDDLEEGDILNFLATHGVIHKVKIFDSTNRRQGLVEFDTVEQATEALVSKHRVKLKGASVRICFSRYHTIR